MELRSLAITHVTSSSETFWTTGVGRDNGAGGPEGRVMFGFWFPLERSPGVTNSLCSK